MTVAARYDARVAHVETIGVLFSDKQEVGAGSGLLVGDRLILTNNHVVPNAGNYKTLTLAVRLKSRLLAPLSVRSVFRDSDNDLALLELDAVVPDAGAARCPMPVLADPSQAPIGTAIFILGFPLNQNLSLAGGFISNHDAGGGRWQTDTLINPGNSGGPAFDGNGALVGLAVGGVTKWRFGQEEREVTGVNFIIPASTIRTSPLFEKVASLPPASRCWTDFDPAKAASASLKRPDRLSRSYLVSETKDDHPIVFAPDPRTYSRSFQAEPGYRITACSWTGTSQNNESDIVCNVDPGQKSASFSFRLTSGPLVDQWRGWLLGDVTLEQQID